ncbi:hypothetical protein JKG47_21280 [Acidithiobacillus sp. MC6.1]|nr:hypothetical protein [Acidithiobacillus sp. MC6.1]
MQQQEILLAHRQERVGIGEKPRLVLVFRIPRRFKQYPIELVIVYHGTVAGEAEITDITDMDSEPEVTDSAGEAEVTDARDGEAEIMDNAPHEGVSEKHPEKHKADMNTYRHEQKRKAGLHAGIPQASA